MSMIYFLPTLFYFDDDEKQAKTKVEYNETFFSFADVALFLVSFSPFLQILPVLRSFCIYAAIGM